MSSSPPLPVSVGILSYGARATLQATLASHAAAGLPSAVSEFFVYFNAMEKADGDLAASFGVAYSGGPENLGIFGGFKAIAERATSKHVLILENDICSLEAANAAQCLASCLADMEEYGIRAFSLRSRRNPGQGALWRKYVRCYPVREPLSGEIAATVPGVVTKANMLFAHGYLSKFKGTAIYVERDPEKVHPEAIRRLPSGNYVTDSRFRNWSNQAVLVERDYFLNVICKRVEKHPDPRVVHGHQDIERAINSFWWRKQREPLGHAAEGLFTHARLDR